MARNPRRRRRSKEPVTPPRQMPVYKPLARRTIGRNIVRAVLERAVESLPPPEPFTGAGIYLIYYTGPFPQYAPIARATMEQLGSWPIYIGRALPKGTRVGTALGDTGLDEVVNEDTQDPVLYTRLCQHAESITLVNNLELRDFTCRYLVLDEVFIRLGEAFLLGDYRLAWNRVVSGFGNKAVGKGRADQKMSRWDTVHPGRPGAAKLPNDWSAARILAEVETLLAGGQVSIPDESEMDQD